MAEYIKREDVMAEIARIGGHDLCEWGTLGVKAMIDRMPTYDAVEVVRCEDCKNAYINAFSAQSGVV